MKKILMGALVMVLIMTFIVCVYAYGEDQVFSLEKWLTNVSKIGSSSLRENLILLWTQDFYIDVPADFIGPVHPDQWVYFDNYEGDNEILEFFDSIRGFFLRVFLSIKTTVLWIVEIFKDIENLFPWNATVPRGEL